VKTIENNEGQKKYAKPVNGDQMEAIQYERHVNEIEKALD
jgi:hypothetical protein